MITIANSNAFAKVIADALASVAGNSNLSTKDQARYVSAIGKAAARIEQRGCFMDYDAEDDRLLIWSDSNEIYEVGADGRCQCKAQEFDFICWHRVAKRLIERYNEAEAELTPNPLAIDLRAAHTAARA